MSGQVAQEPIASWTPPEGWLRGLQVYDGLEVAASGDFARASRLALTPVEGGDNELAGRLHAAGPETWIRLAPRHRNHPWREAWTARIDVDTSPGQIVELTPSSPMAAIDTPGNCAIRVRVVAAARFADVEPLSGCERIPVADVAFSRHTLQTSAAARILDATSAGDWMTPTLAEPAPWWEIDTGAARYVDRLRVHCAAERDAIMTITVFSFARPDRSPAAPWQVTAPVGDGVIDVPVGRVGRHVRVQIARPDGDPIALHLAAVEVLAAELVGRSLVDTARRSFSLFADRPLFAHREGGDGGYDEWMTYREAWGRALDLGNGLRRSLADTGERVFVGVCASGRAEWPLADLACVTRGYVVVPLAHTDPADKHQHIVEQAKIRAVVCGPDQVPVFAEVAASCPSLELIVEMSPMAGERPAGPVDAVAHRTVAAIEALGACGERAPIVERDGADLYSVLYTSGSTGRPKGAMRSYDAFNAMVASYGAVEPAIHLSFQPFSHLSERMMVPVVMMHGGQVGFATGDASRVFDDIAALRPTTVGGVPRIFDVLRGQYNDALVALRNEQPDHPDPEGAVRAQLRALFGDRLQVVSVGSAKPSAALLEFMRETFADCWVSEGYGSTEVGTIAVNGVIPEGVDVHLVDVPELGYLTTDDPPRGEICVRTPHMISGYFGDDAAGADQFDADGYFRTGDIGRRDPDGTIHVIGRRKNVVKLAQGEFVAPELVEAALQHCPLVDQIYVHASPLEACVVAVVVPNVAGLRDALPDGAAIGDEWLDEALPRAAVREALRRVGAAEGLPSYELPAAVFLEGEAMTAESGLLTSSNKPNRRAIEAHYVDVLAELYERAGRADSVADASVLEAVASVAAALVGDVDVDADISTVGVDSLAGVQLVCMMEERLHRAVPMQAWFGATSLADFAERLAGGGPGVNEQAAADLALPLPAELAAVEPSEPTTEYRDVLLTGATGFLGRGLVESLLARTGATVHCLVRGASSAACDERLRKHLATGGLDLSGAAADRVRVVVGDLAEPCLGLDADAWSALAGSVDAVIHAGAAVNWISLYGQLRRPNVLGTVELLRLAATGRARPFHFVSTISTAPADGDETTMLSEQVAFAGTGYGLSKWIAEVHVRRAADAGLPVAVYRPAMIAGHSERGHSNADDFGTRYLIGCAQLGLHLDIDDVLDMTPVDHVSDAIVCLSRERASFGATHHIVNIDGSLSYRRLGDAMRAAGVAVRPASYPAFREALMATTRRDGVGGNALSPLIAYFPVGGFALGMGPWPSARSRETLERLGVACPAADERLIRAYYESLRRRGLVGPDAGSSARMARATASDRGL